VLFQVLAVDAEPLRNPRPEAFDDDVRPLHQFFHHRGAMRFLEIDGEAALVAIFRPELNRDVRAPGIATRRLDLDHLGAEVGEDRRGERPRDEHREVHHPHARERQPSAGHFGGSIQLQSAMPPSTTIEAPVT
jgi:hypothetical protein